MPVAVLKNLRAMRGMGVLADRDGKAPHVVFRRYNLLYGFNGSGKSTLSRLLASLQTGVRHPRLPPTCTFEIELDDGSILACPDKLTGIERRVLVFNNDFVEQNLQWSNARASPVFYIGKEQAALAEELAALRDCIPASLVRMQRATEAVRLGERDLVSFKRERARLISGCLRMHGRKYEAPQLTADYKQIQLDAGSRLTDADLDALTETCRKAEPPAKVNEISLDLSGAAKVLTVARGVCGVGPSTAVLTELQAHPAMLNWVIQGHAYHESQDLKECLFCANPLSPPRMQDIQSAIDGGIDRVISGIDKAREAVKAFEDALDATETPAPHAISAAHIGAYEAAITTFEERFEALMDATQFAARLLDEKRQAPGAYPNVSDMPDQRQAGRLVNALADAVTSLNKVIAAHNKDVDDFTNLQDEAQLAIRKHFLAEGSAEFREIQDGFDQAETESAAAARADAKLRTDIQSLESKIREHSRAADAINKLLHSYLGHPELSIVAVTDGYEIHRNGKLITGLPSEGEKTALALCYFLSLMESEGRKTGNNIVVIDDPISSLDSRSLNFACNLIKSRLADAAQLFVFTHNLNCLNEFRKPWRSKARATDGKEPTAALLFLDVSIPKGAQRISKIIELPALLREYDSEYHYLFHHVLKFAGAGDQYDYAYMMPNVLRRVLEVFLAFRCPGTAPLSSKIDQLCKAHVGLDKNRIIALERLTQVESHSDNLDDLISFSSMTLEEAKDATNALLALMEQVDPAHPAGLRRICG